MIKFLIIGLLGNHRALQYKIFRKWHGGSFYLMQTALPMASFWSEVKFTNCQATCLKEEHYPVKL